MELIATNIRIPVRHDKVLKAITTTAGHRGWWAENCDIGRAVGEEAVYRFDSVEVACRIDRIDDRGIELTCVRNENFPDIPEEPERVLRDRARRAVRLEEAVSDDPDYRRPTATPNTGSGDWSSATRSAPRCFKVLHQRFKRG